MSFETRTGAKALGAKFAGLGIATAVAFAVAGSPAIARADEEAQPAADQALVAVEVNAEEGPAVAETPAAAQAPAVAEAPAQTTANGGAATVEKAAPQSPVSTSDTGADKAEAPAAPEQANAAVQGASASESESSQKTPATAEAAGQTDQGTKGEATGSQEQEPAKGDTSSAKAADAAADAPATPAATAKAQPAATQAEAAPAQTAEVSATAAATSEAPTLGNVYRMYNPNSGEHFYTTSLNEATHLFSVGWRWESTAYEAASSAVGGGQAVYRLYNPNAGAHFYTTNAEESNHLRSLGWKYEGTAWYAVGSSRLYRLYNPNSPIGEHLYTASADERDSVLRAGWRDEGTAWSVTPGFRYLTSGQWVVSSAYGSLERYWIGSDTQLARNRYIETSEGSGWRAYATDSYAVIRNKTHVGNGLMLADNDGRLVSTPNHEGWLVTDAIDGGNQRYYIIQVGSAANGAALMGARLGWFNVGGQDYYAFYNDGYVARNTVLGKNANEVYEANNDGVLTRASNYRTSGWKYAYNVGSGTGWFISTDTRNFKVMVFHIRSGNDPWVMEKEYDCGEGSNTFMGHFTVRMKLYEKNNGTSYCRYNTIYAIDPSRDINTRYQMFHAFLRDVTDDHIIEAGLHERWSAGCIRLEDENAKWIYDNVPVGSDIYNY